ncbi:hypothetical protein GCM10028808_32660 [Spirosoma migulaei]|uniref:hypothetical protein n=1 Tax=Spirosoma sp. KCTC 42546 TaxID=2520506 RepID=UPI00143DD599|nr:hypothetical protein [Spirosoma sp. KCTC 42546]
METQQKEKITPEKALAWLIRSQERKRELQEQFQKDCDSGRIQELLKDAKPAY